MKTIGNILWFLFGGLIGGLSWVLAGCLWLAANLGELAYACGASPLWASLWAFSASNSPLWPFSPSARR